MEKAWKHGEGSEAENPWSCPHPHLPEYCIVLWVHTTSGATSMCTLPWICHTWQNITLRIMYSSVHACISARSKYMKRQERHLALNHRTENKAAGLGSCYFSWLQSNQGSCGGSNPPAGSSPVGQCTEEKQHPTHHQNPMAEKC